MIYSLLITILIQPILPQKSHLFNFNYQFLSIQTYPSWLKNLDLLALNSLFVFNRFCQKKSHLLTFDYQFLSKQVCLSWLENLCLFVLVRYSYQINFLVLRYFICLIIFISCTERPRICAVRAHSEYCRIYIVLCMLSFYSSVQQWYIKYFSSNKNRITLLSKLFLIKYIS